MHQTGGLPSFNQGFSSSYHWFIVLFIAKLLRKAALYLRSTILLKNINKDLLWIEEIEKYDHDLHLWQGTAPANLITQAIIQKFPFQFSDQLTRTIVHLISIEASDLITGTIIEKCSVYHADLPIVFIINSVFLNAANLNPIYIVNPVTIEPGNPQALIIKESIGKVIPALRLSYLVKKRQLMRFTHEDVIADDLIQNEILFDKDYLALNRIKMEHP